MPLDSLLNTAEKVLHYAKLAGGSEADVIASRGTEFEVKVADGKIVTLTQATSKGLGLRVFVDQHMGFCSTSDFEDGNLEFAVRRAVDMARETAADPHNGLPPEATPGRIDAGEDLELYDPHIEEVPTEDKIRWAHDLESVARDTDPHVTKFRDSGVASGSSASVLVTSTGAVRTMRSSGISLWCNPIAERNGELQTEVWYDSKTHLEDLDSVESVGRQAAKRAARMLGAKSVKTQSVPVIFEPHMSAGLVAGILGAIDGDMVYKKASFLGDKLDTLIAHPCLTVTDDPHIKRGIGSTPFDGEGLPTAPKHLIDKGRLTTFLYDAYTARKAGVKPTGNSRRSYGGQPYSGPFNFVVHAGQDELQDLLCSAPKAFLLTRGLGSGVNAVTGEYSRGANGLWLEHGQIVHPVQEVTIAGDFIEMLQNIDGLGTDFSMRGASGAPSLRVAQMMVSGR
jgi:PmbA protein